MAVRSWEGGQKGEGKKRRARLNIYVVLEGGEEEEEEWSSIFGCWLLPWSDMDDGRGGEGKQGGVLKEIWLTWWVGQTGVTLGRRRSLTFSLRSILAGPTMRC